METPESKKFVPEVPQNWESCTIKVPQNKMFEIAALMRTFVGFAQDLPWNWQQLDTFSFNREEFVEALQKKNGPSWTTDGCIDLTRILKQIFYDAPNSEVTFT